jgi:isoamylase
LPAYADGEHWKVLIDTNIADRDPEFIGKSGDIYGVTGRSLILFVRTG